MSDTMALRASDHAHEPGAPVVKVTREITAWQLATAAGAAFTFAAAMYYGQQRQGELLDGLTKDVKLVLVSQGDTKDKVRDLQYELRELRSRLDKIETKKGTP